LTADTDRRNPVVIPVGYPAADATVPDISKKSLDEVLTEIPSSRVP
jgi:hypothetical protein